MWRRKRQRAGANKGRSGRVRIRLNCAQAIGVDTGGLGSTVSVACSDQKAADYWSCIMAVLKDGEMMGIEQKNELAWEGFDNAFPRPSNKHRGKSHSSGAAPGQ